MERSFALLPALPPVGIGAASIIHPYPMIPRCLSPGTRRSYDMLFELGRIAGDAGSETSESLAMC